MEPFRRHRGLVAPLMRAHVDTDQIIPKQFLKRIERSGFGRFLFHDWRTHPDGSPDPGFVLNDPRYAGASILVTGANFGCGSSREHAPWALADAGFRAIVAPSFADIFAANCISNGLLPVTVPEPVAELIGARARDGERYELTIDLAACEIRDAQGLAFHFDVDGSARQRLLAGLDDIGVVLQHEAAIAAHEARLEGEEPGYGHGV